MHTRSSGHFSSHTNLFHSSSAVTCQYMREEKLFFFSSCSSLAPYFFRFFVLMEDSTHAVCIEFNSSIMYVYMC